MRALAMLSCATGCLAGEIPDRWVDALAQVETGGSSVSGDRGRARGPHQFHSASWRDVSAERRKRGQEVHPYSHAWDPAVSACYARTWMLMLATRLAKDTGRWPRPAEVFLAHNMGYEGFRRIGFQICHAPDARHDAALRFETIALSKDKTR